MSREVYTYTDLSVLKTSSIFQALSKYPQITVSADLRKFLVSSISSSSHNFRIAEFHAITKAIDEMWNSDQDKFHKMIILSAFIRRKIDSCTDASKRNLLVGCARNLSSLLSAIILLEQANVQSTQIDAGNNQNLKILVEAWNDLISHDPGVQNYRNKLEALCDMNAWSKILETVFCTNGSIDFDTIVFHGFYYFTPFQARIIESLESAGFKLIFLIPYNARYPFVYEIWEQTYSEDQGFDPISKWHMEYSKTSNPYGEIFNGQPSKITNQLRIKEYSSIIEFVNEVKRIQSEETILYSPDFRSANQILQDYYPEKYGERKMLSYPIGQFISTLNRMWDDELQDIVLTEDVLIDCFSSGWLSVNGVSGKQYMQALVYILPFFQSCRTVSQWESRIAYFKEIHTSAIVPFEQDYDADVSISRWQEAICSPLKNFSMFSVETETLDTIMTLIRQLLDMAKSLFGNVEAISVPAHIRKLDLLLRQHELSQELYAEERQLVNDIFEKLGNDRFSEERCHPSDIAKALDLFICGKFDEGEIQTTKQELVQPFYTVDVGVASKGKVHICLSDVNTLPGANKDYIWPLTGKMIKELYHQTNNRLLRNLIQIMESTAVCNRYLTYCAVQSREVTLSWISSMGEKLLAPSPYIKMLQNADGIEFVPSQRNSLSFAHAANQPMSAGRIEPYDFSSAPVNMIKEARIAYALCPMRYILGYVVEKFPTYQSEFQMNYALNGFISAVHSLMKDKGLNLNEVYDAIIALFPNLRRVERRQVYDYISYTQNYTDNDDGNFTECGGKYYSDERLKILFPNPQVRDMAMVQMGKLYTPDGRKGLDLYADVEAKNICSFCQHINNCRNAKFQVDQENCYD